MGKAMTDETGSDRVGKGASALPLSWLVVGGVLVLIQALVLAAVAIPAPHDGGDNSAYLTLAHSLVSGQGYTELWDPATPAHTKYPPGYPLVLAILMLAGATTWTAFKMASAVALSGATLLAFLWAGQRAGALAAGAVGLLLVLASGWQDASRWILSEPFFLFWTFLALWAADRAVADDTPVWGGGRVGPGGQGKGVGVRRKGREDGRSDMGQGSGQGLVQRTGWVWPVLAGFGALMAFGVRSAGLPVVLALLLAFLAVRRLRETALFGGASLAVLGGWFLWSAAGEGEGAYQDEFWLVDPYDPELGTVGLAGLVGRVWENLSLYVGQVFPGEWWSGAAGWVLATGGILVVGLALWGWISRLLRRPRMAEFFLPLYGGMILLWPQVWSGDRFLLPLLPLLLLYAGTAVGAVTTQVAQRLEWSAGGLRSGVLAAGTLALAIPAIPSTLGQVELAEGCRTRVAVTQDAFACYGPGFTEFRGAAAWMGENLPEEAFVLSRKPRILYALGGPRGRTFPFVRDPEAFLGQVDRMGADYLLVDRVDGVASRYLPGVLAGRPRAFCYVGGWGGGPQEPGTDLVGIFPPEFRKEGGGMGDIQRCPEGWVRDPQRSVEAEGLRVPLLIQSSETSPSP